MGSAHIIGSRLRPQHVLHTGRKTNRPVPIHAWKRRTTHKGLGWTSNSRPKTKKSRPEATPTIGPQFTSCDWIVTQDPQRRILANASVRITDGRIEQVGRVNAASKDEVIDCRRKVLIPGLINTHTHLSMTLFRGYADDLELRDWLEKKIWPLESRLTGDMCYQGALLGSLEMTRTGTTCFVDMYFHMEDVARAVDEAGLRAILSPGMIDKPDKAGTEHERRATLKFLE